MFLDLQNNGEPASMLCLCCDFVCGVFFVPHILRWGSSYFLGAADSNQRTSLPYSDLLVLGLTHTQTCTYTDSLIARRNHTQIYSYSDLLIPRLTHTQTYSYSDLLILRPSHSLTYSTHSRLWGCLRRGAGFSAPKGSRQGVLHGPVRVQIGGTFQIELQFWM